MTLLVLLQRCFSAVDEPLMSVDSRWVKHFLATSGMLTRAVTLRFKHWIFRARKIKERSAVYLFFASLPLFKRCTEFALHSFLGSRLLAGITEHFQVHSVLVSVEILYPLQPLTCDNSQQLPFDLARSCTSILFLVIKENAPICIAGFCRCTKVISMTDSYCGCAFLI